MSKPSITQQVIKYCEMGFFPICKLQHGQYQIYTPFKYEDGDIVTSMQSVNLESAKKTICTSWSNLDNGNAPTEIIGFYHHGFKPFEVGDKVVLKNYNGKSHIVTIISNSNLEERMYTVEFDENEDDKWYAHCFSHYDLEPYLESTQSKPLEVTLEDIAKRFGVDKISIVS